MSAIQFLNLQPKVEYGSVKDSSEARERSYAETSREKRDSSDRFDNYVDESRGAKEARKGQDDKSVKSGADKNSDEGVLYVQDEQGALVEIPVSLRQLQHLANLDRVSVVDQEVLDQFGGLNAFMDAIKSLLPGQPELSDGDMVYLPYQIEALSEQHYGTETFPQLIAVNLSPAELDLLAQQLDGQSIRVSFLSAIDGETSFTAEELMALQKELGLDSQELSGELMNTLQLLVGGEVNGSGKWFQQAGALEKSLSSRDLAASEAEVQGTFSGLNPAPVNQNSLFGKIISHFAQNKGEGMSGADVSGSVNSFGNGSIVGLALNADTLLLFSPDAHLTPSSGVAVTDTAAKVAHGHGVLGAHKAGQTHQATQLVATTIQKSAENGGNQKLSVLLNPPELGRVQLDVQMDAESKLKVQMVTERESAYLLLQRDSGAIEQALQNAGLDVESGDIELSFAGNEFFFGHEDKGSFADFGLSAGGESAEGQEDGEVVETQPDVFRDPYTGMWHYNIIV